MSRIEELQQELVETFDRLPLDLSAEEEANRRLFDRLANEPDLARAAAGLLRHPHPRVAGRCLGLAVEGGQRPREPLLPYQIERAHLEGFEVTLLATLEGDPLRAYRARRELEEGLSTGAALRALAQGSPPAEAGRLAGRALGRDLAGAGPGQQHAHGSFLSWRLRDSPPAFGEALLQELDRQGALTAVRAWRAYRGYRKSLLGVGEPGWLQAPLEEWPLVERQGHELLTRHLSGAIRELLREHREKLEHLAEAEPLGGFERVHRHLLTWGNVPGGLATTLELLAARSPGWQPAWSSFLDQLRTWATTGRFLPAIETRGALQRELLARELDRARAQGDEVRVHELQDAQVRLAALLATFQKADATGLRLPTLNFFPVFAEDVRPLWWLAVLELGLTLEEGLQLARAD